MIHRRSALAFLASSLVPEATSAAPITRLLFVHGRGQAGLKVADLQAAWLAALAEGFQAIGKPMPRDLQVDFPFYGDILERFVTQASLPTTSEVVSRGGTPNNELLAFQNDVAQSIRQQLGVPDDQVLAEYGNNPKPRGPLNWEWVQAILRAIDHHGGGLSADGIERFTRDVYLYLTLAPAREAVDAEVRGKLTGERTLVVAHSLGSVVAYNVLHAGGRPPDIPLFMTVGSPLGIRAIRDQLVPVSFPSRVRSWYNAFDTRDVVALFPLDGTNFPVSPPIENFAGVRNQTENRHGIAGYLNDKHVAAKVLGALVA